VSPSLQRITDVLIDSAVRDSPELIIKSDADTLFPNSLPINGIANPAINANGKGKDNPPPPPIKKAPNGFNPSSVTGSKHLLIDGRSYFAVSATAEVLVLLLDYLRVVVNLSLLTTDTMSRVIEFLKSFNSRTCQVVLGAGAMRSAGLKNITAKHLGEPNVYLACVLFSDWGCGLALASQSLSIMFELIPYVRETFRRHLSPKQAVMLVEFDKLKRVRAIGLSFKCQSWVLI
jgi:vacuolar protein sorting-associated protein 54